MSRRRKQPRGKPPKEALRSFEAPFAVAFPAADPVGHFVISLAAAHNDLVLTNKLLFPPAHPERGDLSSAEHVALLRLVLSQLWEVHLLVRESSSIPEVGAFIDRLGPLYPGADLDGSDLVAALRGEAGVTVPRFRELLRVARNLTNHYEKPNSPKLIAALTDLSDGAARVVTGRRMPTLRAEFADDVLLRMALDLDEDQLAEVFSETAASVIAVIHLAQVALDIWLTEHGAMEVTPPT